MTLPAGPLIAWYGDDFTGAGAVMEVLTFAGLPSVLFLDLPTPERLARFEGLRGIGIAGNARTQSADWMAHHLPPVYEALRATGAPVIHYKICSTLDSAPHIGSIGTAADLGLREGDWAPVLAAAPQIGRWQAFGNLFAAAGDNVERLDRHPTMSVHPVTPMNEADLRRHIGQQTSRTVGLIDLRALKSGTAAEELAAQRAAGHTLIAIDVVDAETLTEAGRLIWSEASKNQLFTIGSQGIEYALTAAWRAAGDLAPAPDIPKPAAVDHIAAVSGSCSPVTARQIEHATQNGWAAIRLDPTKALDPTALVMETARVSSLALAALGEGQAPLVITATGPDDPEVARFREAITTAGADTARTNARLGGALGSVLRRIVQEAGLTRAAIAGGDTSSMATEALGLWALTAAASIGPGAPLLRGHGDTPATDGIEISLKGGQMGAPDYFSALRGQTSGETT
ncbi:four-carbon acid sugar kinase family protein [Amaricoccus tamworthensis]|uniref:four-carbon acid sugar kinase family protein n=1 Tax=Amaricoccus tamworthensis TaxID=57002 RepID=UPI003C7C9503